MQFSVSLPVRLVFQKSKPRREAAIEDCYLLGVRPGRLSIWAAAARDRVLSIGNRCYANEPATQAGKADGSEGPEL